MPPLDDSGAPAWPPATLRTARLTLRAMRPADRPAVIDLLASPEVRRFLGGAADREELEKELPRDPSSRPGRFVVDEGGAMIGSVVLERRDSARPGRAPGSSNAPTAATAPIELSNELLPRCWGQGLAYEACTAVLDWAAAELPGEPIVVCTQTANEPSLRLASRLGFVEVERFEEFGAEQWFGVLMR